MPTKRKSVRRRRAAIPPDPPGFAPVTRDDMTDLALLPQLFRLFATETRTSLEGIKFSLDGIREDLARLGRHVENLDQRSLATDRRVDAHAKRLDDHEKRIERLEGEARKGTES